jgi:endonuclease/exonuclease/phosphatase family metal-dependent hydrolase
VRGVALLVRENIISQTQIPLDDLCLECLDAVAVLININNKPTLMVSAYQKPKKINIEDFVKLMGRNESVIIAGDLNSKHGIWGCRVDNQSGRKLNTWIAKNRYTILAPTGPTHIPTDSKKRPDILDVVVTKSFPFRTKQETLAGHSSDHKPVKITFYW